MTYIDLLSRNLAKSAITAALLELSEESINFTDVTINSSEEDGEISEISFSSSDSDDEETVKVTLEQREALLLSLEQSELAPVVLKTKNELSILPPIEPINVEIPENAVLNELGHVLSIVDEIIVIQSVVHDESKVLDVDSLITLEDKTIVGRVFEVFGSVKAPLYSIRFNDKSEINQDLLGKQVFIVDSFSKYVFTNTIKDKGSDASNLHDEEVEDNEKEFSDDEQEQEFKKRTKRKNGVQDEYETVIDSSIYDPLAELVNEDLHIPPAPVHSKKFQKNTQKSAPKVQNRYQGNNNRNNQNNHSNHQGNQNNHQGNNQINYQSNQGNYQGTQGNKHQRNDQRQRNNNNSNNNSSKPLHISPLNQPQSQQQMSIEQHHQMAAFQFQQMAMFHQQMIAQSQGSNGNQPGMMHGSINSGFGNFNQFNQMQGIQQNNSFPMQGFGNFNQNGIPGFPMPMNSQMPIIPMINQQFTAPVSAAVSKPHPIANINQSIPTPMFPGSTAGSSGFPAMPKTMNPFAPMTPVIEADKIDFGFNTNQGQTINGSRRYGSFNGGV